MRVAPSAATDTLNIKSTSDEEVLVDGDPPDAHRTRTRVGHAPPRSHFEVHGTGRPDLPRTDRQDPVPHQLEGGAAQEGAGPGLAPPAGLLGPAVKLPRIAGLFR